MADPITLEYKPFESRAEPEKESSFLSDVGDWFKDTFSGVAQTGLEAVTEGISTRIKNEIIGGTGSGGTIPAYEPVPVTGGDLQLNSPDPSGIYYDDYGRPYLQTNQSNRASLTPTKTLSGSQVVEKPETIGTSALGLGLDTGTILLIGIALLGFYFIKKRK